MADFCIRAEGEKVTSRAQPSWKSFSSSSRLITISFILQYIIRKLTYMNPFCDVLISQWWCGQTNTILFVNFIGCKMTLECFSWKKKCKLEMTILEQIRLKSLSVPYWNVVFLDGDNFCKAFAGAQVSLSYHEWQSHEWYDVFTSAPEKALQKLSQSRKAILK